MSSTVKPLSELQQLFCDGLRSSEPPAQALLDEIVDDGLQIQRFNVYRNNFIVLNGDALADMYPVIKRLLGDEAFRMLATAYVRKYPPMDRALLLYGERFPNSLQRCPNFPDCPTCRMWQDWSMRGPLPIMPMMLRHWNSGRSPNYLRMNWKISG